MEAMDFYYTNQQAILTAVGALSGIIAHNAVYIRGEWHVQAPQITIQLFALYAGCPVLAQTLKDTAIAGFLQGIIFWSYGYLPGLIASILLYRIFFHPLTRAGFKGPWYARCTKIWHMWAAKGSKNHLVLNDIHKKYGSFVRTGKNPPEKDLLRLCGEEKTEQGSWLVKLTST